MFAGRVRDPVASARPSSSLQTRSLPRRFALGLQRTRSHWHCARAGERETLLGMSLRWLPRHLSRVQRSGLGCVRKDGGWEVRSALVWQLSECGGGGCWEGGEWCVRRCGGFGGCAAGQLRESCVFSLGVSRLVSWLTWVFRSRMASGWNAGFGMLAVSWVKRNIVERVRVTDGHHDMLCADARGPADTSTAEALRPPPSPLHPRP